MPFGAFIIALFDALARDGVAAFVLRNYEGFPAANVGSDVDFLIRRSDLARAVRALQSIPGIRVVGYAERHYVAHLFVEGVTPTPGVRALGIDFIWSMNWKGVPYVTAEEVLAAARPLEAGSATFYAPSPVHEAIISLLASLIIGGRLKEKYLPKVRQTFGESRSETIACLRPLYGEKVASRLVDAVIADNRQDALKCVWPLRLALVSRGLWHHPWRSTFNAARYHLREFMVRCTPQTLETICFTGAELRSREELMDNLLPLLKNSAKLVERRPFGPPDSQYAKALDSTPGVQTRGGFFLSLASMLKIVFEAAKEWLRLLKKRDNLTLRISQSCTYHLPLGAPRRREEFSWRFTRLVWNLLPAPDLWILLDSTVDQMLSGNPGLTREKAEMLLASFRMDVKTRKSGIIIDASRPDGIVVEEVVAAILAALVRRTQSALQRRF
jgi:hypothetical protein